MKGISKVIIEVFAVNIRLTSTTIRNSAPPPNNPNPPLNPPQQSQARRKNQTLNPNAGNHPPHPDRTLICPLIDRQRAVNEIALIDTTTGEVQYGIDSLFKIIGHSFPLFRPFFNNRAFTWLMRKAYAFISYNRKVIIPPPTGAPQRITAQVRILRTFGPAISPKSILDDVLRVRILRTFISPRTPKRPAAQIQCTTEYNPPLAASANPALPSSAPAPTSPSTPVIPQPSFNIKYRLAYLLFTVTIAAAILTRYAHLLTGIIPAGAPWLEYFICSGQILYQGLVVTILAPAKRWEYLGNMMTISLAGSLALAPALAIAAITHLSPLAASTWFLIVAGLMLLEHIRRTRLLGLDWTLTISWVFYRLHVLLLILW